MNDLVSVIIPMYNSEKYIHDTIKSIISQTYDSIEIVVIDDGSSDRSADIVKKLMKSYFNKIRYYYQNNRGVSAARNNGIEKAKGKYIAFVDSDDLWVESKIEKQVQLLNKTGMKACYCGFLDFFEKDNLIKKRKMKFSHGRILYDFLKDNTWCWTSTWIIDKSLIKNNNITFTESCSWGEDFEFFIKVASLTEVCCVKQYLALYRIRPNSLTTSSSFLKHSDDIYVWMELSKWIKRNCNKLIYKNTKILDNLIYGFRVPFSLINYTYAFIKNSNDIDIYKNINLIQKKIHNEHIKNLELNNGLKSIKLYVKLFLINYKLYKCKITYKNL